MCDGLVVLHTSKLLVIVLECLSTRLFRTGDPNLTLPSKRQLGGPLQMA